MKTKYYSVQDLMRMGNAKEFGFSKQTLLGQMQGQLTIYGPTYSMEGQMSIYDLLPKKPIKKKVKVYKLK